MPAGPKDESVFPPDERLSKRERLRGEREFARLRRYGKRKSSKHLVLLYEIEGARPAFGIAVGRRVGGAVGRSLVRRRIRESYRRSKWALRPACMLFIARYGITRLSQLELNEEMKELWCRAGLWRGRD